MGNTSLSVSFFVKLTTISQTSLNSYQNSYQNGVARATTATATSPTDTPIGPNSASTCSTVQYRLHIILGCQATPTPAVSATPIQSTAAATATTTAATTTTAAAATTTTIDPQGRSGIAPITTTRFAC